MLENLTIKNFVIVDELEVNLSNGFSVLTGETGAGKSILIDALSLCLGQRGEPSLVRKNKDKADIIATFSIENNTIVKNWLKEKELLNDNTLILRRVISSEGKSKAFVNGIPTILSDLKLLGELLVDIYSQNFHYSLLKSNSQRDILDNFAGAKDLVEDVNEKFDVWQKLYNENEKYLKNHEDHLTELDELILKDKEYKALEFTQDNWEKLQSQHKMFSNSEELIEGIKEAINLIDNDSNFSIRNQLNELKNSLSVISKIDNKMLEKLNMVESLAIDLIELEKDLEQSLRLIDIDEDEKNRMDILVKNTFDFLRKYQIQEENLEKESHIWQERISILNELINESGMELALQEAKQKFEDAAKILSKKRQLAASKLSQEITVRLDSLAFNDAKFEVSLNPCEPSKNGNEKVDFYIGTYKGAELRPLSKVASGGELSRLSLAIRVSSISDSDVPIMIFDEVDVGIGGGVAETIGLLLKSLGEANNKQVFVITHLPQVAAQSTNHYKVSKITKLNETISKIKLLDDKSRIEEVARMLGGIEVTSKTLEHAKEILS